MDNVGPAFPEILFDEYPVGNQKIIGTARGMTLLDYFAAHALRAYMDENGVYSFKQKDARAIYDIASLMIAEKAERSGDSK